MRFSLNFIKEFVDVLLPARELANRLTMVGMEVEHFEPCGDDWVFDIEVTSNRYDWLSMLGIAREVAAACGCRARIVYPDIPKKPLLSEPAIIIEDERDCPLYIARVIRSVTIKDAPAYMRSRLINCGLTSINNVVDITNYCMLTWGNPLHAFDADKLHGDIYVRRAKSGEQFIGIDGKERRLSEVNLVIADSKKVVALAGVMGAKNTEVDAGTKNIFLEAALFSPVVVRRSRRAMGLDTDSSYRFERKVFGEYVGYASAQASNLIAEHARGTFAGWRQAGRLKRSRDKRIAISLRALNDYLGDEFPKKKVTQILSGLGFTVRQKNADILNLGVPGFRLDIERDVDVYEEFIRVFGYENICDYLPHLSHTHTGASLYHFKSVTKHCLATLGFKEIVTYSIEASNRLADLGYSEVVTLTNPLREQENALRPQLVTGSLDALRYNINRGQEDMSFFELANVYMRRGEGFIEKPILVVALCRNADDFATLKGVIGELLQQLSVSFELHELTFANFTNALAIVSDGVELGFIGRLDTSARTLLDIKKDVVLAHLDVTMMAQQAGSKRYAPFSAYPAVWRDVSVAYQDSITFKDIEQCIRQDTAIITQVCVIDTYQGKDIPANHRACTVRIYYQSRECTLTSQEVDGLQVAIRQRLAQKQGVLVR
ncbi:MAG: phenylalanine--tRNA ligase subunit beta [Candidatus Omnitrophica bacterium]|nr:phenylalanine--tRNA ligase subunit beta [Candidatus Omnitrophota bacterium]